MKFKNFLLLSALLLFVLPKAVSSHCEIPCGIYNDEARFTLLAEHITTIEKSMTQITTLSTEEDKNYNQIVRWVNNKEEHASKIVDIVTQYFLTQRIKVIAPDAEGYDSYVKKVTSLHAMIRSAMKCKQTIELSHTTDLSKLLEKFKALYLSEHK